MQETAGLLPPDVGSSKTAVAVAIAKLGEPAVVAQFKGGGSFIGTGRALSAAAGRLSYVYGLKVRRAHSSSAQSFKQIRSAGLYSGGSFIGAGHALSASGRLSFAYGLKANIKKRRHMHCEALVAEIR